MFDSEDVTKKTLEPPVYESGFTEECLKRIHFRLEWINAAIDRRKGVLQNGNLGSLEPEIFCALYLMQDLIDTMREALTMIYVNFRKEQGIATPPNEAATSSGTQDLL